MYNSTVDRQLRDRVAVDQQGRRTVITETLIHSRSTYSSDDHRAITDDAGDDSNRRRPDDHASSRASRRHPDTSSRVSSSFHSSKVNRDVGSRVLPASTTYATRQLHTRRTRSPTNRRRDVVVVPCRDYDEDDADDDEGNHTPTSSSSSDRETTARLSTCHRSSANSNIRSNADPGCNQRSRNSRFDREARQEISPYSDDRRQLRRRASSLPSISSRNDPQALPPASTARPFRHSDIIGGMSSVRFDDEPSLLPDDSASQTYRHRAHSPRRRRRFYRIIG